MADIIKLLPDNVANQIAAGEVVQRPASAVKELLENSLDSGATAIRLLIKDGGSTLIQVIDNGCGMSETDARMCWERHATSKIHTALDIYSLRTFGFRGEALASIAAVAQVEMKTRRADDEAATFIRIEGSTVMEQSLVSAPQGTSISIKNLFYNIPARRNFLKSVSVETRHIIEEFQRQALAWPGVAFQFYNNGNETFNLKPTDLKNRIREVLGVNKELLETREETEIVGIQGFIGAPDTARKTKGDQYFYVNNRFIRSPYFNHAVQAAFEGLAEPGSYPLFVLHLHLDPARVDVNVHPTKTEVKFEDDKHIYNIIKAAVRKTLGNFVVQPDMELFGMGGLEGFLQQDLNEIRNQAPASGFHSPEENKRPSYNPFAVDSDPYRQRRQDWTKVFGPMDTQAEPVSLSPAVPEMELNLEKGSEIRLGGCFQLANQFVVASVNEELYVIDPRTAHEKILFERFRNNLESQKGACQQLLFPRTAELNPSRLHQLLDLLPEFKSMGFDLGHFGGNTIIINGIPPELGQANETAVLEKMLDDYETTQGDLKLKKHDSLALSLARQTAIQPGARLDKNTMEFLINALFTGSGGNFTADRKPAMVKIGTDLLMELFRKQKPF